MTRKTKADLEREVTDLQSRLILCESRHVEDKDKDPPVSNLLEQWGFPALLAVVLGALVWFQRSDSDNPGPGPSPDQTIEAVTEGVFNDMKAGYAQTFTSAAERVRSGEIKTDQELFAIVQPALVAMRKEKQRPFDQIFNLSLPRGEDGSFAGKETEVAEFLLKIAKSW